MPHLDLREISYVYRSGQDQVRAVDQLSYGFEAGLFYAIVGKSGCGKSTLLALMAGLDLAQEGDIFYAGQSLSQMNRDIYRQQHASLIFQSYNLFPLLTATENIVYSLRVAGVKKQEALERAQNYLQQMGLSPSQCRRMPGALSGGEQQRVAIARALAKQTDLILADEPTGNLDSENGENIVSLLISAAHDHNRCVIMVTHDPDISGRADHIIRMKDGRFVASQEDVGS